MAEPKHFLVLAEGTPPTKMMCECGLGVEGPNCVEVMEYHIEEGNKSEA